MFICAFISAVTKVVHHVIPRCNTSWNNRRFVGSTYSLRTCVWLFLNYLVFSCTVYNVALTMNHWNCLCLVQVKTSRLTICFHVISVSKFLKLQAVICSFSNCITFIMFWYLDKLESNLRQELNLNCFVSFRGDVSFIVLPRWVSLNFSKQLYRR